MKPIAILALAAFSAQALTAEPPSEETAPEPVIVSDPVTVYTKAFWRRPTSQDKILHAERREWLDTSGNLASWQWFLVVEPSPQTLDWLASNPFLLQPAPASQIMPGPDAAPDWFSAEALGDSPLQDATGHHVIALSGDGKRLYATDSGNGFASASTR